MDDCWEYSIKPSENDTEVLIDDLELKTDVRVLVITPWCNECSPRYLIWLSLEILMREVYDRSPALRKAHTCTAEDYFDPVAESRVYDQVGSRFSLLLKLYSIGARVQSFTGKSVAKTNLH